MRNLLFVVFALSLIRLLPLVIFCFYKNNILIIFVRQIFLPVSLCLLRVPLPLQRTIQRFGFGDVLALHAGIVSSFYFSLQFI